MLNNMRMYRQNIIALGIVVIGLILIFYVIPPIDTMPITTFLNFFIATVVAACYPLKIEQVKRLNVFWLVIPVLYMYGVAEMLLFYQLAILFFLGFGRTKEGNFVQYPIYACVFFMGPLVTYSFLFWSGLRFSTHSFVHMLMVNMLFYGLFLVISGCVFVLLKPRAKNNAKQKAYMLLEAVNSFVFILLGTALYALMTVYGEIAIIGALLCYVVMASISRHYDATLQKSVTLENMMDLHLNFNESVTKQQLTQDFLQRVMQMTDAKQVSIVYEDDAYFIFRNNELEKTYAKRCQSELLQSIFANHRLHYVKKQAYLQMDSLSKAQQRIESILAIPMPDFDKSMMLLLESDARYAFDKENVELCQLLIKAYKNAVDQQAFMQETIHKSERCVLTGLYNYRYLTERLQEMERQFVTGQLQSLATIILDIDHFKQLNDTYGHENGNRMLKEFALRLQSYFTDDAILTRYGGEEFVVLLPNKTAYEAQQIAEGCRRMIEQLSFDFELYEQHLKKQAAIQVTVSIGVAAIPEHTNHVSDLISFADRALYVGAKQRGRNRVAVFQEALSNEHAITR